MQAVIMEPEISRLKSLAKTKDVDGFVSTYVSMREGGFDVGDEGVLEKVLNLNQSPGAGEAL